MAKAQIGAIEYPNPDIILAVSVDALVSTQQTVRTGAILPIPSVATLYAFGVLAEYTRDLTTGTILGTVPDAKDVPLGVNGYFRVRKSPGIANTIAKWDKLTMKKMPAPNADEYEPWTAATKEVVYAIAMEDAGVDATDVLIWGPIWPGPFESIP